MKNSTTEAPTCVCRVLRVRGTVQGVGFRPFIQGLACSLGLRGWVLNDGEGVLIRVQGTEEELVDFERRVRAEAPPAACIESIETETIAASGLEGAFSILESTLTSVNISTAVPADLALCADCRSELLEPGNRRQGYAFINCTQCGPRYSLIEALPYDRERTSMNAFRMCMSCKTEYTSPTSRRYHAEPNACPECGPSLSLLDPSGLTIAKGDAALQAAAERIVAGGIVAVKGLGGFHLFCDAAKEQAIAELRRRKQRDEKALAVMFPSLEAARAEVEMDPKEAQALLSAAAPIVLLKRSPQSVLPLLLAPGNPWLGVLLPYTPLHVMLLRILQRPLVATSANLAEEPLCTDELEALSRLRGIADLFLSHDRKILRPVDDSVLRLDDTGGTVMLRRARGFAPTPLMLPGSLPYPLLCAGAQLKASLAIASGKRVVLSPHIGDLENLSTQEAYENSIRMLSQLCGSRFERIACDKHPGYDSTRLAARSGLPLFLVQHHLAHLLACLLEHRREADDVLGVIWDGTGLGEDGTIWGGEFLLAKSGRVSRFAHLRRFSLPGGDAVAKDARRSVFALLHEDEPDQALLRSSSIGLAESEAFTLSGMLKCGLNSPRCSSMGRLFDAAALLLGLGRRNSYEGHLALQVEAIAAQCQTRPTPLPFSLKSAHDSACLELNWRQALQLLSDQSRAPAERSLAFHQGLAEGIVAVARRAGAKTVALSGGCFQNVLLLKLAREALTREGFLVVSHRILPPGDGAIAAGQALGALWGLGSVDTASL